MSANWQIILRTAENYLNDFIPPLRKTDLQHVEHGERLIMHTEFLLANLKCRMFLRLKIIKRIILKQALVSFIF